MATLTQSVPKAWANRGEDADVHDIQKKEKAAKKQPAKKTAAKETSGRRSRKSA
ncbi:hypothetical protein [Streptomyces sp. NPDC085932]|uniref:hypothetical protein n=1 Tax=Streptomyces sp. NPDC085932 TaxID=3365741 RepID=UPI0037D41174